MDPPFNPLFACVCSCRRWFVCAQRANSAGSALHWWVVCMQLPRATAPLASQLRCPNTTPGKADAFYVGSSSDEDDAFKPSGILLIHVHLATNHLQLPHCHHLHPPATRSARSATRSARSATRSTTCHNLQRHLSHSANLPQLLHLSCLRLRTRSPLHPTLPHPQEPPPLNSCRAR